MNKENTERLLTQYSKFFKHKDDLRQSLMGFGFECDQGWYPLIEELLRFIEHKAKRWSEVVGIKKQLERDRKNVERDYPWITDYFKQYPTDPFENFEVVQVKEKFGGLRFYVFGGTDETWGAIHFAEQLSYRICEICGCPGSLHVRNFWYKTLCEKCAKIGLRKEKGDWVKVSMERERSEDET